MAPPSPRSRTPRRWFPALTAALVATGVVLAPTTVAQPSAAGSAAGTATYASPSPQFEAQFVSRINSLRASKGLRQLQVSSELTGVARNWTEQMVRDGHISHNPNLGSQVSGNWTKLGENVGVGYDVDGLMQAFINSSAHYKNLVDPDWNWVGVGVVVTPDGRMWTTHNFMARGSNPPPPPPPPPTTPPPTSPPTTKAPSSGGPGTTAPATTTTTAPPPPPKPTPHPTAARVTAVLDPLRSLERG